MAAPVTSMAAPTSAVAQAFWSQPREDSEWERLWNLTDQPHRQVLLQQLHLLRHFKTLTEVGTQVGTNLRLIRQAFPWVTVTGVELNPSAVAFARRKFIADPQVEIVHGSLVAMAPLPPTDVVVTCYSLAYVAPTDILTAIKRLATAAKVGLVLVEPNRADISELVRGLHFPEWIHPISALLAGALAGRRGRLINRAIDPPVDRLNLAVTAVFL